MEAVKVNQTDRTFQVHGIIPASKKSGIIGKSFKGLMALSTMECLSRQKK